MNDIIQPTDLVNMAELDIQISTAKKYKRDVEDSVSEAATMVTTNKKIAESCFYALPRKDKGKIVHIMGPSVRLAEIIAQAWGNLHAATRIIPSTDNKTISAEAVAWDLEKNTKITTQIKKNITYKNGATYSQDMQNVTANAAASIALRNAIFRVIPKVYIDNLYDLATGYITNDNTQNNKLENNIERVFKYFNGVGYNDAHILSFLSKKNKSEITSDDIIILSGIKNRIDDGQVEASKSLPISEKDFQSDEKNMLKDFLGASDESVSDDDVYAELDD